MLGFMGSFAMFGVPPTAVVFVIFIYVGFDQFMAIPWPPSVIGQWIPALKVIPTV